MNTNQRFRTARQTSRLHALAAFSLLLTITASGLAEAASSASIIMYHRFGEAEYPSTSVTLEQLEAHIAELKSAKYSVLPLGQIVDRLIAGQSLPERAVAITIDDAYRTTYTEAWPRFRAAGLPITVFVATSHIDRGSSKRLTWDQLREMAAADVTIGQHSVTHLHMPTATPEQNRREIADASARFTAELGLKPDIFAYPYGETSLAVTETVIAGGFKAAFGQHSGVAVSGGNMFYLPRFAMNEKYGDIERLRLAINALALPVADVTPRDPMIGLTNPPAMGFTVVGEIGKLDRLRCFTSHAGKARLERLGKNRFEIRSETPFPRGRTRLNCTQPTVDGRWRWYGRQFFRP